MGGWGFGSLGSVGFLLALVVFYLQQGLYFTSSGCGFRTKPQTFHGLVDICSYDGGSIKRRGGT